MNQAISAIEYAALATDVYKGDPIGSRVLRFRRQNFYGDPDNGFFAAAYQHAASRSLVVAFRGSGGDLGDWTLTGNVGNFLGLKLWDSQLNTAFAYFDALRGIYSPETIAVCGHSLGGFLAAMVSLKNDVRGVTFDRPTLGYSALRNLRASGRKLVNFHAGWDYVSLVRDGYGRWITVDVAFFQKLVAGRASAAMTHSMDHMYEAVLTHPKGDKPPEQW